MVLEDIQVETTRHARERHAERIGHGLAADWFRAALWNSYPEHEIDYLRWSGQVAGKARMLHTSGTIVVVERVSSKLVRVITVLTPLPAAAREESRAGAA